MSGWVYRWGALVFRDRFAILLLCLWGLDSNNEALPNRFERAGAPGSVCAIIIIKINKMCQSVRASGAY